MTNFGEQINLVIDKLAEKLGVAADKVYPVLEKQAQIDARLYLSTIIIGAILLLLAVVFFIAFMMKPKKQKEYDDYGSKYELLYDGHEGWFGFVVTTQSLAFVAGIIMVAATIAVYTRAAYNPEFYILDYVLQMLG